MDRPALLNGPAAGQQMGYFSASGYAATGSSPFGNAVSRLPQMAIPLSLADDGACGQGCGGAGLISPVGSLTVSAAPCNFAL